MTSFTIYNNAIHWNGVRLSMESVEALLDLFDAEGDQAAARTAFHELYDANLAVGGFERVTSLRRFPAEMAPSTRCRIGA